MIKVKKTVILLKKETTYGVDASPEVAQAVKASSLNLTPLEGKEVDLANVAPYYGAGENRLTAKQAKLDFEIELSGAGTAGASVAYASVLEACGMSETITSGDDTVGTTATGVDTPTGSFTYTVDTPYSGVKDDVATLTCTTAGGSGVAIFTVSSTGGYSQTGVVMTDASAFELVGGAKILPNIGTDFAMGDEFTINLYRPCAEYEPVSDDFESASIYVNQDGINHKILGARGNAQFVIDGTIPKLKCSFEGLYVEPYAVTLPSNVDLATYKTPVVHSKTNTPVVSVHGFNAILQQAEFNLGQQVSFRQRVNDESVEIADRKGSGSVTIEEPDTTEKNFYKAATDHDKDEVKIVHGVDAGNVVEISVPKAQLQKPSHSEAEGMRMLQMGMIMHPDAGNDEFKLTIR